MTTETIFHPHHGSGVDPRVGESSSVSGHVGFFTNAILEDRRLENNLRRRNTGSLLTQSPSRHPSHPVPSRGSSTELSNSVRSWLSEFTIRVLTANSVYLVAHHYKRQIFVSSIIRQCWSLGNNAQVHSKI